EALALGYVESFVRPTVRDLGKQVRVQFEGSPARIEKYDPEHVRLRILVPAVLGEKGSSPRNLQSAFNLLKRDYLQASLLRPGDEKPFGVYCLEERVPSGRQTRLVIADVPNTLRTLLQLLQRRIGDHSWTRIFWSERRQLSTFRLTLNALLKHADLTPKVEVQDV